MLAVGTNRWQQVTPTQLASRAGGTCQHAGVGVGQFGQQDRAGIVAMHAAGRQAKPTEQGLGGGEHALDPGRYTLPVEPPQGHQVTSFSFRGTS
ncbi:hypothetical protein D3C78_1492070 [compost metagenome]